MSLLAWAQAQSNFVGGWLRTDGSKYTDFSANSWDLTPQNAVTFGNARLGDRSNVGMVDLNGTDEYALRSGALTGLDPVNGLTFMTVVKCDNANIYGLVYLEDNGGTSFLTITINAFAGATYGAGKIRVQMKDDDGLAYNGGRNGDSGISDNKHHVLTVRWTNPNTLAMWKDGVSITINDAATNDPDNFALGFDTLWLGKSKIGADYFLPGDAGPTLLFNTPLATADILIGDAIMRRQIIDWHLQPGMGLFGR
jgi:hypothetical protein